MKGVQRNQMFKRGHGVKWESVMSARNGAARQLQPTQVVEKCLHAVHQESEDDGIGYNT